jgi:hypothetical protein
MGLLGSLCFVVFLSFLLSGTHEWPDWSISMARLIYLLSRSLLFFIFTTLLFCYFFLPLVPADSPMGILFVVTRIPPHFVMDSFGGFIFSFLVWLGLSWLGLGARCCAILFEDGLGWIGPNQVWGWAWVELLRVLAQPHYCWLAV